MQGMMIEYAGNSDHFTGEPGFTIHMGNQGLPGSSFHTAEDPGYSVIPLLTLEYPGWPHLRSWVRNLVCYRLVITLEDPRQTLIHSARRDTCSLFVGFPWTGP
jgi:hypothetical protein